MRSRSCGEIPRRVRMLLEKSFNRLGQIAGLTAFFFLLHGEALVDGHAHAGGGSTWPGALLVRALETTCHVGVAVGVAAEPRWKIEPLNFAQPRSRSTEGLFAREDADVAAICGDDEMFAHEEIGLEVDGGRIVAMFAASSNAEARANGCGLALRFASGEGGFLAFADGWLVRNNSDTMPSRRDGKNGDIGAGIHGGDAGVFVHGVNEAGNAAQTRR